MIEQNKILQIAVLMTCHNRKNKTLGCLKTLCAQELPKNIYLSIYLVDDGSTDGTGDSVRKQYPQVNLFTGDGNLYWNGGMRRAFGLAKKKGFDYYLWLNDDVCLYSNAILVLFNTSIFLEKHSGKPSIVTGSMQDPETGSLTYGGNIKKAWYAPLSYRRVEPKNYPLPCDTINGNCVLIPHEVVEKIGNLSPEFTHGAGDYDYSLRANRHGFSSFVAPGFLGTCGSNSIAGSCKDKALSLKERQKILKRPTALPPAKEWMIYARRHAGFLWPVYWVRTYFRLLSPKLWLLIRSKKSN